jgi:hypothetical protein
MTTGPPDPPRPTEGDAPAPSIAPAFLWIVVAAIASAFVAIWGVQYVGQQRERVLTARVDSLRAELTRISGDAQRLQRKLTNAGGQPDDAPGAVPGRYLIDDGEINELRGQGLADPVHDLKKDLMKHPELIPFPGVEGGRMGFYSPDEIAILGGHWAFARFEDGHIGGTMLLEYKVDHGRIAWKRLVAVMD